MIVGIGIGFLCSIGIGCSMVGFYTDYRVMLFLNPEPYKFGFWGNLTLLYPDAITP